MATFNLRCPKNYPRRCNLLETEKEQLERAEKYTAFLMYQFKGQDEYLVDTVKSFFHSPTYHVFDAGQEAGLGIKICKICRLAQASDFGIVILTPENLNVYLEAGLIMGMGKRNIYIASRNILKANNKTLKDVAFDLSDQLVIEHRTREELLSKFEIEVPQFIDNVIIGTALEREQRAYWREKFEELNDIQKQALKFLSMVSEYSHWSAMNLLQAIFGQTSTFRSDDFERNMNQLWNKGMIQIEQHANRKTWKIDPIAEPFIHKLLFETT